MSLTLDDDRIARRERDFDAIVQQLLDEATFGDFVPVLAWRYAGEELSVVAGVPAEYAAD